LTLSRSRDFAYTPHVRLSDYTSGRDNNFNLIRFAAAFAVLLSHSFALTQATGKTTALRESLGPNLGLLAVDVFFIASGFLVTGSLLSRQSVPAFLWARALRIYPALIVVVLLSVFVLGPCLTTAPASQYWISKETFRYLYKNMSLVSGVTYTLPGLFDSNPHPRAVNGSLWTMPYEVRLYAMLALTWILSRVAGNSRPRIFKYAVLGLAVFSAAVYFTMYFLPLEQQVFVRLAWMFSLGAACCVMKDRFVLSGKLCLAAIVGLALSALLGRSALFIAYNLLAAYLLLFLAYVPAGKIRHFNRLGDYSYGVYIYAFPVQQSIVAIVPDISMSMMFVVASAITLVLAALSWHVLEQPALRLKNREGIKQRERNKRDALQLAPNFRKSFYGKMIWAQKQTIKGRRG
jgi:peptidoglycan/LPS O-acetylase OafA/YrhL